jgi:CRP/FNR family transcriptional regulator, cyclic AMP receptor protein
MKTLNEALAQSAFFRGMRPEHLAVLTEGAQEMQFNTGDVLFREGDPSNQFYWIESGKITLETRLPGEDVKVIQILSAGEALGWSWLFPPFTWNFSARTIAPTRMISFSGGHLLVSAEENHDLGYELMKRVGQILIQRLQSTRQELVAQRTNPIENG